MEKTSLSGKKRRALITGIGVLAPVGLNRVACLNAIAKAQSGIKEITAFDPSPFRTPYGGEIVDFDPSDHLSEEEVELWPDRNIQLALVAARQAFRDAGIDEDAVRKRRVGLVVGTCNGGLKSAERQYEIALKRREGKIDRKLVFLIRYHSLGKALSRSFGLRGPTWCVATACSSSTGALGVAVELIERGIVDVVLVGGSDALCLSTMAGFDAIRATSTGRTAPFSTPVGLNLGEGAAFWVVEEARHAHSRGAKVEGRILGYALTADAHHPTAPDPMGTGALRTMQIALERAGIDVSALGCINAHGTGTDANDRVESKAISKLTKGQDIPVYSFKSQVGHCLGAAGIIEATAGLLAMKNGLIPATINFSEPRPGCQLNYVRNEPIAASYNHFLSCNYAFGGNNAGVVIGLSEDETASSEAGTAVQRTVLTGGGMVTSLGLGSVVNLEALRSKRRGLASLSQRVDGKIRAKRAGLVPEFDGRDVDRRIDFKGMKLISRFATAAARLALAEAGLRVGPRDGKDTGVINGVNVGPNEEDYLTGVVASGGRNAEVGDFSHVVANATGGWVSNALALKGYSTTVAEGPDAGLFALLLAHYAIAGGSAPCLLAGSADELYSRHLLNYDSVGFLHEGDKERHYGINLDVADRRVLGEGAAYVVAESLAHAEERGRVPIAEIVGHGMTTDKDGYLYDSFDPDGSIESIDTALTGAGWDPSDVALVLWTPEGNRNDRKPIAAVRAALGTRAESVPFLTTVFNTGLLESASGVVTLAALVSSWSSGVPLWPQVTGHDTFDNRALPNGPGNTLVLATSEIGFNLALAIQPYQVKK